MFSYTTSFDHQKPRCPADFSRDAYARGLRQERVAAAVTVTAAAFSPCGGYLVCASDSGRLAVWGLDQHVDVSTGEDTQSLSTHDTSPDMSWRADRSCINCLCFAGDLLLCGGDESLFGCSWAAIVSALEQGTVPPPSSVSSPSQGQVEQGVLQVRCPQGAAGTRTRSPEINGISYDKTTKRVLCAAGDGNAYQWDLESLASAAAVGGGHGKADFSPVRTYKAGHGYLHAVASAPGASVVATGSDDGYLGVWDSRVKDVATGGNLALLRPAHARTGDGKEPSPGGPGGTPDGVECVTSLQMGDGGDTIMCGGRRTGGAVVAGGILEPTVGRGWVNQWSLADLKATKVASLPAEVQCMHLAEQGQTLLVAGAEPTLTSLSRSELERKARTPVAPDSIYALAVNGAGPHEGVTCVAGVGPTVQLCTLPGALPKTLCFV
eukprot:g15459.t1